MKSASSSPGTLQAILGATFVSCLLLLLSIGCGSEPSCVPGQSIACSRGNCRGYQVCRADGKAYDECRCSGSSGDFPETGPYSGLIGATCTSAADCREGFDCLSAESSLINGEGPSAGICLARCLPEQDFCIELDARSRCIVLHDGGTAAQPLDDIAYCLPGCVVGTRPNEEDKCRSRIDLVCAESPTGSGVGYCRPACRADIDCGHRFCNLATGLCGDRPFLGDPIGAPCDADSATSSCAGGCIEHGSSFSECSGVCSYGTAGCGDTGASLPLDNFCYLDPTRGAGAGDLGYCARVCDCDDDCDREDAVCEPQPSLEEVTGRAGVCASKDFASGGPRANIPC